MTAALSNKEAVGERYVLESMRHAQQMTWKAIEQIARAIFPGMHESDAVALGKRVLGELGMDYAAFDTVVDGKRLEPGDTDAFYAMLAAVGRQPPAHAHPTLDALAAHSLDHQADAAIVVGVVRVPRCKTSQRRF